MNDLELGLSTSNPDLFRSNSGAVFPYSITNLASITGHNSPWGDPEYYYFFYNLQMMENCKSEFAQATAVFMTPQSDTEINSDFNLYPNPTSGYLIVENDEVINTIKIYDIQSRELYVEEVNSVFKKIDVSDLSSGVYFIELFTDTYRIRKEFVVQGDNK